MKKIISFMLAVMMIAAALASCGDDKPTPPVGGDDTNAPSSDPVGTDAPEDTEAPEEYVYIPNAECEFSGKVAYGTSSGNVYFDEIKLVTREKPSHTFYDLDFESMELPEAEATAYVGSTWQGSKDDLSVIVDPSKSYRDDTAENKKNHVLAYAGDGEFAFTMGEKEWNYYQFSAKVLFMDEDSTASLYFCIQDEKNYYVLTLGEEGHTKCDCYRVVDGVAESVIGFKVTCLPTVGKWYTVGISLDTKTINIYLNGYKRISLFDKDFVNQYYDYSEDVIPASITEFGYGAPGEGEAYFTVTKDNVIHDGKGTSSNSTSYLPTKAFDFDIATFYSDDEKNEYENTERENFGIYGDGTFETAYLGVYIENGAVLKHVRYCPRTDNEARMVGGIFQGSVDGEEWTDLYTIEEEPLNKEFTLAIINNDTVFNYFRYVAPAGCYGNVAELEFWGFYQ